jgi:polyketide cyclase/dehydrase/lipid transport protein
MSRPWLASGLVEAPVDMVFAALLAVGPVADAHPDPASGNTGVDPGGMRRYRATIGDAATTITVEVDPDRHILAVQGNWWYRGVYTVSERPPGSLIEYRVHNIAARGRWAVPLMQHRLPDQMRRNLDALLRAIGRHLNRRAYLKPDSDTPAP